MRFFLLISIVKWFYIINYFFIFCKITENENFIKIYWDKGQNLYGYLWLYIQIVWMIFKFYKKCSFPIFFLAASKLFLSQVQSRETSPCTQASQVRICCKKLKIYVEWSHFKFFLILFHHFRTFSSVIIFILWISGHHLESRPAHLLPVQRGDGLLRAVLAGVLGVPAGFPIQQIDVDETSESAKNIFQGVERGRAGSAHDEEPLRHHGVHGGEGLRSRKLNWTIGRVVSFTRRL